ncbi:MAG: T9SS type A sorting domain-containing protein [bacterium]|nr:T9SS type A sorting domain-containing protein [bacterium]
MKYVHLFLLTALVAVPAYADFTQTAPFTTSNLSTYAVAWGDYDGDDDLDLAVGNIGQNYLYVNSGPPNYTFTELDRFGMGNTSSMCWGDYDNDNDLDLAVGIDGTYNLLYENTGGNDFTVHGLTTDPGFTQSLAWGDHDYDSDLDLAVGNDGQNYLQSNDGIIPFSPRTEFGAGATYSLAWAEYTHDEYVDASVGNDGQCYIYKGTGSGEYNDFHTEFGAGPTRVLAPGDYDNDGDLDAADICHNEANVLYTNDGTGGFSDEQFLAIDSNMSANWADFDNDGDLDIAVSTNLGSNNYLYLNDGLPNYTFSENNEFGTYGFRAMAWGDYDNDGDLDLAAGNENGMNYLFENDVNDAGADNYLTVIPFGDGYGGCNSAGIGARVYVFEAGHVNEFEYLRGLREVTSHSIGSGQDAIYAFFGLPDDSQVDVRITWPRPPGKFYESEFWAFVDVGGEFVAVEGTGTPLGIDDGDIPNNPRGFYLASPVPNPSNGNAVISYIIPETTDARLEVFDVKGRKIATLAEGEHQPGEYSATTNGLSSGLYLYRLSADEFSDVKKMVVR